ncbi:MAG: DNA mismatch repair protein MutS [Clostridiaceae bacterium]|nr:DNA mismatch repair protein MutS [Clostridiaceae bacterium]
MNKFITTEIQEEIGLKQVLQKLPVQSPYGKDAKENIKPYLMEDLEALKGILTDLRVFLKTMEQDSQLTRGLKRILGELKDIKGSIYRAKAGEILSEVEFFEIKKQMIAMEKLRKFILNYKMQIAYFKLAPMKEIVKVLDPEETGMETFYIYDVYSEVLIDIRKQKRQTENIIHQKNKILKEEVYKKTGVKPKLNGEIIVLKEDQQLLEKFVDYDKVYQTAENFRSFIFKVKPSEDLKTMKAQIEDLKQLEEEEEFKIRKRLSKTIGNHAEAILNNIDFIGKIDFTMGKAILALQTKAVEPQIVDYPKVAIKGGRHVVVEEKLKCQGSDYTPIDVNLDRGVTLITGANMGGKTITLKMMALLTAMTQLGLYPPAEEVILGPVAFIYFSSGDQQSAENGLSTFGAEIQGLKEVIERAEDTGLILIDELARGTNPIEGYGISKGVIQYLKKKPSLTVITTHFDGLGAIEAIHHLQVVGLKNVSLEILRKELEDKRNHKGLLEKHMDYRLEEKRGEATAPKDAIMVAKLMGLTEEILTEAKKAIGEREGKVDDK